MLNSDYIYDNRNNRLADDYHIGTMTRSLKVLDEFLARTVRHTIQNRRFWILDYGCYKAQHPKICIQKDDQKNTGNNRFWMRDCGCLRNGLRAFAISVFFKNTK